MLEDGGWLGVDGDFWYSVSPPRRDRDREMLEVESNGTQSNFVQLFRLDHDASEIERKILDLAPELAPYISAFPGLRIMRPSCAVECFFSFLCTPNNNLNRIVPMVRRLAEYGPVIAEVDGTPIHRFPDLLTIAAIPETELRAKGFGYRAASIPPVARQVLERGEGWIEGLKAAPDAEVHAELCTLKSVGPKLADCIALFALHHTQAIPIDTHIWQAYIRLYRPEWKGKSLTDSRYREAATFLRAKFGDLGGWAQQCLFYDNMLNWRSRRSPQPSGCAYDR